MAAMKADEQKAQPKRGRPKGEPGTTVSVWMPTTDHDRIVRAADARRVSVSSYVRRRLLTVLQPE
jgi:hypothetical protein